MTIVRVQADGNSGNKLLAFPEGAFSKDRVSLLEFICTGIDLGPGELLRYASAEATVTRGDSIKGYTISIVGPADEVKVLYHQFLERLGYQKKVLLPIGFMVTVTSFMQRMRWLFTGKW